MMAHGLPGRLALDATTVARVKELLSDGLSLRTIARQATAEGFPVSKTTVDRIKRGKHLEKGESTSRVPDGYTKLAVPERCPICGDKITIKPCLRCSIRATNKLRRGIARPATHVEE